MTSGIAPHGSSQYAAPSLHGGPVLMATTGTGGEAALLVARDVAAQLGAGLRLVSVLEIDSTYLVGLEAGPLLLDYQTERREEREALVRRQCEAVLGVDPRGVGIRTEVRRGEVARALQAAAVEHRAALVVVGHDRRDLAHRLVLGEAALRIARRAPCPVLLVSAALEVPVRTVVAAIDFSAASLAAARAALPLLAPGGTMHLVHAWPRLSDRDRWMREHDERYVDELPERLSRAAALLGAPPGVHVETTAVVGDAHQALLAHAARTGATLVTAGNRGQGMLDRLLLGSVATRLMRTSEGAVLIAPGPAPAEAIELRHRMESGRDQDDPALAGVLQDFARRNRGRRVLLEEAGAGLGVHVEAMGYELLDVMYDPHADRALLMLGRSVQHGRLLTHSVPAVRGVTTVTGADGRDAALRLQHGDGWTLLTFVDGAME